MTIEPQSFAIAHLAIIALLLLSLFVAERRGRNLYVTRNVGSRYRRLSSRDLLKRLRKAGL